jgi:hypothetical protein
MSVKQRVLKILCGQCIIIFRLTVDLLISKLRGRLLFRIYQCIMSDVRQTKGSLDSLGLAYSYVQFNPLRPLTFFLTINSLISFKHKILKILSGQHFSMPSVNWPLIFNLFLYLWQTCKQNSLQSHDIEQISSRLPTFRPTYRQVQSNTVLYFEKEGGV